MAKQVINEEEARQLGLRTDEQLNVISDDFVKIYTNNVRVTTTNWDTSLLLGEIMGLDPESGKPVVEMKVKVNMTREFMKALANLLVVNVKEYEAKFGEISFEKLFQVTEDIDAGNAERRKAQPVQKKKP